MTRCPVRQRQSSRGPASLDQSSRGPAGPVAIPLLALLLAGCGGHPAAGGPAPSGRPNTLTPAEAKAGWRLLFDGSTTKGWRAYNADSMPSGSAGVE